MNIFCAGKKSRSGFCKMKVSYSGEFCTYHKYQEADIKYCKCELMGGDPCPIESIDGELCESHQERPRCINNNTDSNNCDKYVLRDKQYCSKCYADSPIILDSVKEIVSQVRQMSIQKHGMIARRSTPKSKSVNSDSPPLDIKIVVPKSMIKSNFHMESCPICLDEFEVDKKNSYRTFTCGHSSHVDCLSNMPNFKCAVCRYEIPENMLPKTVVKAIYKNMERHEKELHDEYIQELQEMQDGQQEVGDDENLLAGRSQQFMETVSLVAIFIDECHRNNNTPTVDDFMLYLEINELDIESTVQVMQVFNSRYSIQEENVPV
jgi:hypothetical protein